MNIQKYPKGTQHKMCVCLENTAYIQKIRETNIHLDALIFTDMSVCLYAAQGELTINLKQNITQYYKAAADLSSFI